MSFSVRPVSVSYRVNRLQPLPFRTPVIQTLNPVRPPLTDRNELNTPARISAEEAAQKTLAGIERGSFEIHYPQALHPRDAAAAGAALPAVFPAGPAHHGVVT
jgi:hypothetical protein